MSAPFSGQEHDEGWTSKALAPLANQQTRPLGTQPVRVLPADVYDALEFSALVEGGIGARSWTVNDVPNCAVGHAWKLDGCAYGECELALSAARITELTNDEAVREINERRGQRRYARVPFADRCAELGVVRGETVEAEP